jgi:hypothetical protein
VTHRKQKTERNVEKKGRTKISGRSEVTKSRKDSTSQIPYYISFSRNRINPTNVASQKNNY